MQEYRSMHKQQTRGQLPHNKLLYPESLRYLALWVLGETLPPMSLIFLKGPHWTAKNLPLEAHVALSPNLLEACTAFLSLDCTA